jgi:diguanylate cyclase (GGDEF)-like protein
MQGMLNYWRFYGLKREQYYEIMKKAFKYNLRELRIVSMVFTIFTTGLSLFPLLVEGNKIKAIMFLLVGAVSLLVFGVATYKFKRQQKYEKQPSNMFIYHIMVLLYIDMMLFCIYLGVWSNTDKLAASFMSFLICALFLFINPPQFNLFLTLMAFFCFLISSISFKTPQLWMFDIVNAFVALMLGLIFGWQISMMRIRFVLDTRNLENERNNFYKLSTIDELTQLKNRRDFMKTFKRFIANYRQSDQFLCIAIMDIDFFKDYNDYYGHLKGDECLRAVSKILRDLQSAGVYAARVGGEEFAMIWFEAEVANASNVTEHIKQKLRELNISHKNSKIAPYVTTSIGVHIVQCGTFHDINTLYGLADKALYAAKNKGRNCTVFSQH